MSTPAIEVPERFNAAQFFVDRHLSEGRGARVVFRFEGQSLTYAELAARINRVGNTLRALGVEMENRVLLALPDSPEFAEVFWGAIKIGAVAVPVNPWLKGAEYAFLLQDSRAKVAVVHADVAREIAEVRERCRALHHLVVIGPQRGNKAYERLLSRASPILEAADTSKDDAALWGYTSGSTGRPKAAVHLHHDLLYAADLVGIQVFGICPEDLIFSASKMFFLYGLGNSLYFPARVGATSLLVAERLEPEAAFATISRERPTVFFTVPTLYARMLQLEDAGQHDLSSLRLCVSSGEALPPALFHAWKARFGHELIDVVGSTEALHDFIANRPGEVKAGASGKVIPGFEARLVDDQGMPVEFGTAGHLLIKGETTAPYYWNRHERTKETMLGEWLRTGDMFSQDQDGYFYFCGRSDDMLKVAGLWVAPTEVEGCLAEHPAVLEAGVIGREDAEGLVKPHAFVVLKDGFARSEGLGEELRQHVRERLAGYKVPRWVELVRELPQTTTGKIQRFRLRHISSEGGSAPLHSPAARALRSLAQARLLRVPNLPPELRGHSPRSDA